MGDDAWCWKNVKERFKKIESYHVEVPEEHRKYVNPKAEGGLFLLHLSLGALLPPLAG